MPLRECTIMSNFPSRSNTSSSCVHSALAPNEYRGFVWLLSPVVAMAITSNSRSGCAALRASRTMSVWTRASLDFREPIRIVLRGEEEEGAEDKSPEMKL